jgi:putative heme-binding domain-containing protein
MREMIADVGKLGDPARGEAIFRRQDLVCLKCHAIAGAGGQVGPDLSSVGASAPVDYIIDSILLPNKIVKEGFHSLVVYTKDGRAVTGIKVRENKDELVLRTSEDKEVVIRISNIDERVEGRSLMPDGLADPLTRAELVDLVRFLSEMGKLGPYSVSKARLVRRWQVLAANDDAQRHIGREGIGAIIDESPDFRWSNVYSQVSGVLPIEFLPHLNLGKSSEAPKVETAFVRFQVDVSTAGKIKLLLNSSKGLTIWVDRTQVETKPELILNLAAGLHTITVSVNMTERKDDLLCELDEVEGSPARARIIGGK